jgi:hypothetical protein
MRYGYFQFSDYLGQLAFTVVLSTMFCVQSIKLIELLRQRGGETA